MKGSHVEYFTGEKDLGEGTELSYTGPRGDKESGSWKVYGPMHCLLMQ